MTKYDYLNSYASPCIIGMKDEKYCFIDNSILKMISVDIYCCEKDGALLLRLHGLHRFSL